MVNEVEISCLPDDLPSFIEVDLANLEIGKAVHFSDIAFPKGVTPVAHSGDDPVIVTVTIPGAAEQEPAAAAAPAAAPAAKK